MTHRSFAFLLLTACSITVACGFTSACFAETFDVWIGAAEAAEIDQPNGVYHATLDSESGTLTVPQLVGSDGVGFIATHPTRDDVLYATGWAEGKPCVVAWRIVREDGVRLQRINHQPTGDGVSCHISVDATGSVLMSAQYMGASVVVFPLEESGALGQRSAIVEHEGGSGVVPGRQDAPHPHWTGASPDNRFALAPDLGKDRIVVYRLDTSAGTITPHSEGIAPAGAGPRHLAWSPDGRFAYVIDELTCALSAYTWDADSGELSRIDTQPMMTRAERGAESFTSASEVAMHPSGDFVYAAVRGHDRISVFRRDQHSGKLTRIEREPIRGSWPRHFGVSPDGRWLVAAGRNSNTLTLFSIEPESGELRFSLKSADVPRPIVVVIR